MNGCEVLTVCQVIPQQFPSFCYLFIFLKISYFSKIDLSPISLFHKFTILIFYLLLVIVISVLQQLVLKVYDVGFLVLNVFFPTYFCQTGENKLISLLNLRNKLVIFCKAVLSLFLKQIKTKFKKKTPFLLLSFVLLFFHFKIFL